MKLTDKQAREKEKIMKPNSVEFIEALAKTSTHGKKFMLLVVIIVHPWISSVLQISKKPSKC